MFSVFNLSTLTMGTISDVFENMFCFKKASVVFSAQSLTAIVILR